MAEMVTVSFRLPKRVAAEIEKLARQKGVDKSAVLRELVTDALRRAKTEAALNLVRKRKITLWKAAEMAGTSLREMLELLPRENVPYPISPDELEKEIEEIEGSK